MMRARPILLPVLILVAALFPLLFGCISKSAKSSGNSAPISNSTVETPMVAKVESHDLRGIVQKAASKPSAVVEGEGWKSLFDGRTLTGWQLTDFRGHGAVHCESGLIVIERGSALTGINWTNEIPKMDYEIALEAMRLEGSDFFCGLTIPVGDTHCTLILGGWGGRIVGVSSINGDDASDNQTSQSIEFDSERWYGVRVRVTGSKIQAWLDQQEIVNLDTTGLKISMRFGDIELSKPMGVATWKTSAAIREIKIRPLGSTAKLNE